MYLSAVGSLFVSDIDGYVSRREVFRTGRAGLDIVRIYEGCEDSSFYGCLRSYSNKQFHNVLVSGDAVRILEGFLT